jgi:hypothetical protein
LAAKNVRASVVHLVRDSRAVAHSMTRRRSLPAGEDGAVEMERRSPRAAARHWLRENRSMEALCEIAPQSMRLQYEALVADPAGCLRDVLSSAGLDETDLSFLEGDRAEVGAGHSVSGNPMRFDTGPIEIRCDDAWRREMPAADRRRVTRRTRVMLTRYGYSL